MIGLGGGALLLGWVEVEYMIEDTVIVFSLGFGFGRWLMVEGGILKVRNSWVYILLVKCWLHTDDFRLTL